MLATSKEILMPWAMNFCKVLAIVYHCTKFYVPCEGTNIAWTLNGLHATPLVATPFCEVANFDKLKF